LLELERTAPDRIEANIITHRLDMSDVIDAGGWLGHIDQEVGARLFECDANRIIIELLGLLQVGLKGRGEVTFDVIGGANILKVINNRLSIQRRAIVELSVLYEREGPDLRIVGALPRESKTGVDVLLLVNVYKRLVNLSQDLRGIDVDRIDHIDT